MTYEARLRQCRDWIESGHNQDEAYVEAALLVEEKPDDPMPLFLLGTLSNRAGRHAAARAFYQRALDFAPHRFEIWNNLGLTYSDACDYDKAFEIFNIAIQYAQKPEHIAAVKANLAQCHLERRELDQAEQFARECLDLTPDNHSAKSVLGFINLMRGNWREGWAGYHHTLYSKFRQIKQYQDEPLWDGSTNKTVLVYGEQGLGDEIMYASCLPDMIKVCKEVIVECDERLGGLFKRSFPKITVYPTRRSNVVRWEKDHQLDASIPCGELPRFFRSHWQYCPGKPYLVADPERRLQWRALFDSWGKPVIGLAWSGGTPTNLQKEREIGLEAFRPLIEAKDAIFVSLQYKDPTEEIKATGLPVKHYKRATETADYDDTAAMIAELDEVIGVHTTALHCAGALGKKTTCLVPSKSIWVYALPEMPWYKSVKLVRQAPGQSWSDLIKERCL